MKHENEYGSGMHFEVLHAPIPEEVNPVKKVIEELFSHELSNHQWRKWELGDLIKAIEAKIIEMDISLDERHAMLLLRSIKKCKTVEAVVLKLNEHLMGE